MVQDLTQGAVVQTKEQTLDTNIAIYFDIIQEHSVNLMSEITDNWMENNTVIGDHIANAPLTITLRGLSGEVVYVPNNEDAQRLLEQAKRVSNIKRVEKLSKLTSLYPPIDNLTQLAKNVKDYVEASADRYIGIIKQFTNSNNAQAISAANPINEYKIKIIYDQLEKIRLNKLALLVETPFKTFDNMYIQSLVFRQGNVNYQTDIELTLKQVYFMDSQTTKADEKVLAKYSQMQRADVEDHGKTQGIQTNSFAYDIFTPGKAYINK